MKEKSASQAVSDSVISQFFNASFHLFLGGLFLLGTPAVLLHLILYKWFNNLSIGTDLTYFITLQMPLLAAFIWCDE